LAGSIPDLNLNGLRVDLDASGSNIDTDGGLEISTILASRELTDKVRLPNSGVPDEHQCNDCQQGMA